MEPQKVDLFANDDFKYKLAIILLKEFVKEGLLSEDEFQASDRELRKLYRIIEETPLG